MTTDPERLVAELTVARTDGDPVGAVRAVLDRATRRPAAVAATVERHPFAVLHRADDLSVQVLRWPPGFRTVAHDHGGLWAMVGVCTGAEENTVYRRVGDGIIEAAHRTTADGEVLTLGPDAVHDVRTDRWTIAIHVYGGDLFGAERVEWRDGLCRPYDGTRTMDEFATAVRSAESTR